MNELFPSEELKVQFKKHSLKHLTHDEVLGFGSTINNSGTINTC